MTNPLSLIKEDNTQEKKPWYKDGLRFNCTGCGQCCTGAPGYVWVSDDEIAAIAKHLKLSTDKFSRQYIRFVKGRYSLIEDFRTFDCIFLKDKKCQIYQVRPKQCRTYPWWPDHLQSEEAWLEESKWCEGINCQAPVVPLTTIEEQLAIQTNNHEMGQENDESN